ncbi:MAG: hypothetical protein ACD_18C00211G0002 [uncultured bacterium]|nr:MAG: hypothetical protein ACD_18C00211G0002 [uncultured bacterium]OGH91389.1 MAG: hypothetical protein A2507_04705 [Candidatus Magasanikbacteria bacterium RIFOXYD12_FULL_33_17]HAO52467.1 four helix bundle protein [Candidatus Magasanikbacteria bacterium]
MEDKQFHKKLRKLIVDYIVAGYETLKQFPSDEKYGMTSQCKRALVSIFLNYTEGYARISKGVTKNLYEIAYGSLKESIGVFFLATKMYFIPTKNYISLFNQKEEIAKMLWKSIEGIEQDKKIK